MTFLELDRLTVARGDSVIVHDCSFSVNEGETIALVGPSGCGKSTLLASVAGLISIAEGRVHLAGQDITEVPTHLRSIGLVPQGDHLFPQYDVNGNIAFGLRRQNWDRARRQDRVDELLSLIDLAGFGQRRVDQLSGGQSKRVALARALAPRPRLILLDEPLTGLDADLHSRLMTDLAQMLRSDRTTAIWVTHDLNEAVAVADRIIRMDSTGRIHEPPASSTGHLVTPIAAAATHDLRRRVLRDGTPTTTVEFDGDEGAIHLGVSSNDRIIAISSWFMRPFHMFENESGLQLRGMASDPDVRGSGAAAALMQAGIGMATTLGCTHVWARARDTALGFYLHQGFQVIGEGYIDETTGLAHHDIARRL